MINFINYIDENSTTVSAYGRYAPLASSALSLGEIFLKYVVLPKLSKEFIEESHYFTYLEAKTLNEMLWSLVPIIGNIYCYIHRYETTLEIIVWTPACLRDNYFINFWKKYDEQKFFLYCHPRTFDYLNPELQNDFINQHGEIINDINCSTAIKWLVSQPGFFRYLDSKNIEQIKKFVKKNENLYQETVYQETVLYKLLFWNKQRTKIENIKANKIPAPELKYLVDKNKESNAEEIRQAFKEKKDIFQRKPGVLQFSQRKPDSSDKLWEDLKFISYIAEKPKALKFMNELSKYAPINRLGFKQKLVELTCKNSSIKGTIDKIEPEILVDSYETIVDSSPEILFSFNQHDFDYLISTPEEHLQKHKDYLFSTYNNKLLLRIIYDKDLTFWRYLSTEALNKPEVIKVFQSLSLKQRGVILVHIRDKAPQDIYKITDSELKLIETMVSSGTADPLLLQCIPLLSQEVARSSMEWCDNLAKKYLIISIPKELLQDHTFNPQEWRQKPYLIGAAITLKPELLHYLCNEKGEKFANDIDFMRSLIDERIFVCAGNTALKKMTEKEWNDLMGAIRKRSFPWSAFPPSQDFIDYLTEKNPEIFHEILSRIVNLKQFSFLLLCQKRYNKNHPQTALPKPIITKIFLDQYSLSGGLNSNLYGMMNPRKEAPPKISKSLPSKNTIFQKISSSATNFFSKIPFLKKIFN